MIARDGSREATATEPGARARWSYTPAHASYSARRVATEWPRVRVEDVDARPRVDGDERVTVRACVHLGALFPADVEVELVTGADAAEGDAGAEPACPLWSVQSYRNGTFVFESSVPARALNGVAGFGVRVTPYRVQADANPVLPILRWIDPEPANRPRPARTTG